MKNLFCYIVLLFICCSCKTSCTIPINESPNEITPEIVSVTVFLTPNGNNIIEWTTNNEMSAIIIITGKNFSLSPRAQVLINNWFNCSLYDSNSTGIKCDAAGWNNPGQYRVRVSNPDSDWSNDDKYFTVY